MSGRYIIPPPPVKDIEEGDVLEINNDLFVAVEDSTFVGQTAPFDKKNEKHAVKLRGANSGQSMCHLAEIPIEKNGKKELFLWSRFDRGYKERSPVTDFKRCFRTNLKISTE